MPSARSAAEPRRSRPPRATAASPRYRQPQAVRPVRPWSRVRWDRMGRVALLVVLAIVAVLYAEHILSLLSTRAQAERERATVQALARQNRTLLSEQRALNDPAAIQRRARALGMVRVGERAYAITGQPGG